MNNIAGNKQIANPAPLNAHGAMGCFVDGDNGNIYGIAFPPADQQLPPGHSSLNPGVDAYVVGSFGASVDAFERAGADLCAPTIAPSRIQLPKQCPTMTSQAFCQNGFAIFEPDAQARGNSDAYFHCLALAGVNLGMSANNTCPPTFAAVTQFDAPAANHSGVAVGAALAALGASLAVAGLVSAAFFLKRSRQRRAPDTNGLRPLVLVDQAQARAAEPRSRRTSFAASIHTVASQEEGVELSTLEPAVLPREMV